MKKTYVLNVEAVIKKDNNFLIIERSDIEEHAAGTLSFPGGKVEADFEEEEVLEKALKREILEEVGIQVEEQMQYVESKLFTSDDNRECIDIVFVCKYKTGIPRVGSDEVASVKWMTYEEIVSHEKTPSWIKQSLEKVKQF